MSSFREKKEFNLRYRFPASNFDIEKTLKNVRIFLSSSKKRGNFDVRPTWIRRRLNAGVLEKRYSAADCRYFKNGKQVNAAM